MDNRKIIDSYYEYANAGKWMEWCDLFAENQEMDEQLAGHISGLATLRDMMRGMGQAYAKFQNVPKLCARRWRPRRRAFAYLGAGSEVSRRGNRGGCDELLPLCQWQNHIHGELPRFQAVHAVPEADRRQLRLMIGSTLTWRA